MMHHLSFWERETWFKRPDVVVIGGGIVGLNAAISLKVKAPGRSVSVLERGFLPYGASTRNAGFACFGSPSELLDDLNHQSESEVFETLAKRWKGLKRLRKLLGDEAIEYEETGNFEVFSPADRELYGQCREKLDYLNERVREATGLEEVYGEVDEQIARFGLGNTEHLLFNRGEGLLHTGKMMERLLWLARNLGVRVLTGAKVVEMQENSRGVSLKLENGIEFESGKVLICANGFAKTLIPEIKVQPARAQVLITEPVKDLPIRGGFHFDRGYYYFRHVGNRILFGGGRNLNPEGETTTEMTLTEEIQQKLEQLLREVILPGREFRIDHRWSGVMGIGEAKSPLVRMHSDHIGVAVRLGGMGVAIGALVGEEGANLLK